MTSLTPDEATILMIANQGESMIPIGRWEPAVDGLVAKGMLSPAGSHGDPSGRFNNVITPKGKQALAVWEASDGGADAADVFASVQSARKQAVQSAGKAASELVKAARATTAVTGESVQTAARNWAKAILDKALGELGE